MGRHYCRARVSKCGSVWVVTLALLGRPIRVRTFGGYDRALSFACRSVGIR